MLQAAIGGGMSKLYPLLTQAAMRLRRLGAFLPTMGPANAYQPERQVSRAACKTAGRLSIPSGHPFHVGPVLSVEEPALALQPLVLGAQGRDLAPDRR